ncbi:MAG TPA: ELWxxDGT repeat protein [Thermoanaerobaculia bacterium]
MCRLKLLLAVAGVLSLPSFLAAQPYLVKDLNQTPAAEIAESYTLKADLQQNVLYFAGSDPAHGVELWRTDGTPAGTYRLTDVCPGRCSSTPQSLEIFRGRLYFSADDGFSGRELWRSDVTPGREQRVRDICPGPCSSHPGRLKDAGDELLFTATPKDRRQLWRTTGSRKSTTPVATLCPVFPAEYGPECVGPFARLGELVFFLASSADFQTQGNLWRSDGTPEGTWRVLPVAHSQPVPVGDSVLFWTEEELWRTDGTAGASVRVKSLREVVPHQPYVFWSRETVWNGILYAVSGDDALVRSDGTPEGTVRFHEFPEPYSAEPSVSIGDWLLLKVAKTSSRMSLWRTRGIAGTTEEIFDVGEDPADSGYIADIVSLGDRVVFRVVRTARTSNELWVTDGTREGTRRLEVSAPYFYYEQMVSTGSQAFFRNGIFDHGIGLWRTDGTETGTYQVKDFSAGPGSAGPLVQVPLAGKLVFSAQTSYTEAPLFVSDGTAAGTHVLSEEGSWATGFARVGSRAFFFSFEGSVAPGQLRYLNPKGLWRTDGTAAGTAQVSDEIRVYRFPMPFGDKLLFGASLDDRIDIELWRSNGTAAGTRVLKDVNSYRSNIGYDGACASESSNPGPGVSLGSRLVFAAEDGSNGRELWVTDGTRAGTKLVADINPSRSPEKPPGCRDQGDDGRRDTGVSSNPERFVRFRNGALFTADDGRSGRELWRTDGTAAGTRRVKDLRPGRRGSEPHDLTLFGGVVYFIASARGAGEALWRTDGTAAGTVLVHDLAVLGSPSWARSLTVSGGRLFLVVYNEVTGPELWTSRGDAGSTSLVAELRPGTLGSYPQDLADAGGVLVFAATDGETGLEMWKSDGTASGTGPLGDINPGLDASSPGPFTRVGRRILFGAYEPVHGRELWAVPLPLP